MESLQSKAIEYRIKTGKEPLYNGSYSSPFLVWCNLSIKEILQVRTQEAHNTRQAEIDKELYLEIQRKRTNLIEIMGEDVFQRMMYHEHNDYLHKGGEYRSPSQIIIELHKLFCATQEFTPLENWLKGKNCIFVNLEGGQ